MTNFLNFIRPYMNPVPRSYENVNVFVSSVFKNAQCYLKYHFFCHINFPLEDIHVSVNCYISIFDFYQNAKSTTVLYIYSILEERPKALLKMFLTNVGKVTLPTRPQK